MRLFSQCLSMIAICAVLGLTPGSAQTLSASKVSAHLINAYTSGSSNIIAGHPRTLKVLGLDSGFPSGMTQAMRDYKTQTPAGKIVVRIYSPKTYSLANDATASATDYWTTVLQPSLNSLSTSNRALIDFLEGPNEGDTPTLGYPNNAPLQASQWFNQFWTNLTPLMVAAGYKPCVGSIGVGNPGGSTAEMQSYLAAFVPALRQAKAAGGAWSYHAYTIGYTTDPGTEFYYSLRYRQFYSYFASAFPDLNSMPMILTEGGVDATGDPNTSGWQARGSAADYEHWLNWFDQQLQQDSYLLGCTLFENGDPGGWSSFDLEPIAGWLKNYLLPPVGPPPAPTGISATTGNGTVTVTWTNAPITPTSWTIKRSTTNGGPYLTLATNITAGVTATTYADYSFTPNVTNYYVVSAVNALGEGTNSLPAAVRPTNGLPDLVVTAITWTPTGNLFSGTNVTFKATVLNQGSATWPAGTNLGIGFLVDGSQVSYEGGYVSGLAVGSSVVLTANGGPNGGLWSATAGSHTITANADDVNRYPEINEDNNTLDRAFNVFVSSYALNSGGPAVGTFAADGNFTGSANTSSVTNAINTNGISGAAPAAVYQTERWGEFAYALNNLIPGSNYTVRLHFAEISSSVNSVGDRRFNVSINGTQVFTNFDILAAAGAKFRALTRDIKKRADDSGVILVQFTIGAANQPKCSGIEAFASSPTVQPPQFTGFSLTNGLAALSWQTSPATIYQVQYKTNLDDPNWLVLGNNLVATGATLSVTSTNSSAPRRFYRIAQIN